MKIWTLAEARRALPLVKRIVRDIVDRCREVMNFREIAESKARRGLRDQAEDAIDQARDLVPELERLLGELTELGVELKDPTSGLTDFRAKLEDRVVYLCWKLGEADIDHWHELEAGFAGRTPLTGHFQDA